MAPPLTASAIIAAGLCILGPAHAFVTVSSGAMHHVPTLRSAGTSLSPAVRPLILMSAERAGCGRRELLAGFGSAAFVAAFPKDASATPVRAPLPKGPADPADKDKLFAALDTLEGLGAKLKDPAGWKEAQAIISQAPFTPDAMDLMFRKAAKNLPPNNLLGSDAGQWAGLAVESVQATDELAAELLYLTGAAAKGESVKGDDLPGLHAAAVDKVKEFTALYDNKIESKVLPGFNKKE